MIKFGQITYAGGLPTASALPLTRRHLHAKQRTISTRPPPTAPDTYKRSSQSSRWPAPQWPHPRSSSCAAATYRSIPISFTTLLHSSFHTSTLRTQPTLSLPKMPQVKIEINPKMCRLRQNEPNEATQLQSQRLWRRWYSWRVRRRGEGRSG